MVPAVPGPLLTADPGRERDDLDEIIDELFPDTDEGAGPFDIGLLLVGAALTAWAVAGGGPGWAVVMGLVLACLGCVLPLRSVLRRLQRRRRDAVLGRGIPLRTGHPAMKRLTTAYGALVEATSRAGLEAGPAIAAGHAALLETATLLRGQAPGTAAEVDYALKRAAAIEQLTTALRLPSAPAPGDDEDLPAPAAVVEAREELEALGGISSLTRLGHLADEARDRRGRS